MYDLTTTQIINHSARMGCPCPTAPQSVRDSYESIKSNTDLEFLFNVPKEKRMIMNLDRISKL